ncbi:MAG: ribonuclease H-like YkuK family protein [Candidatus Liptonbacteria bacterium]
MTRIKAEGTVRLVPDYFHSSIGLTLSLSNVVGEIIAFMKADPKRHYKITVGTDSERFASGNADFVTAVVVHRVGNGGRYFWHGAELGPFYTLRDRIIREVMISLDLGKELLKSLQVAIREGSGMPEWDFEIHADIGENGPTNVMIQEVVGMIRAHNFEPITKPNSYAASNVADRHV